RRGGRATVDPVRRRTLLRDRRLLLFFIGSVALWGANGAILTFFSIRLVDLGADGRLLGLAWAVNAVVEVPLMLGFPALARRFGAQRLVVVGAAAFAIRALGWAVTGDAAASIAIATIGGVGFSLVYVGTVTYVASVAPSGLRATAQAIFSGTAYGLGNIIGSSVGGAFAAIFGLPALFAVGAGVSAIAGVIVWWAIGRRVAVPAAPGGTAGRITAGAFDGG
ncbi:MAG: MFS transporter, partial [Candidatus Limnocylindrales bacterium]